MYNYLETMINDIRDSYDYDELDYSEGRDRAEEILNDKLWIDDGVTGNASGSYFCDSHRARECVIDNMGLAAEALREFCVDVEEIGRRFLNEEWEWLDVTIRCYLLGQAISGVLDVDEEAGKFDDDDTE